MTILDKNYHNRLIADRLHICDVAGIQGRYLDESMVNYCSEQELDWVNNFRAHKADGNSGMLMVGLDKPHIRCQAICGALLRNFIDARVTTFKTLIDMYENGQDAISADVILIPNLYVAGGLKAIAPWDLQSMYDLLLARSVNSKQTVAYVESLAGISSVFGNPFSEFLKGFIIADKEHE
jgi:hypothetical protein